ncbi:MAG: hypothetical protein JXR69_02680 [Candidatus Delongbacteria bacterium]|nr:hypothetical protein [Candidatus Delongbacteria bacterium]
MANEKEKLYYQAVQKWAEKSGELAKCQSKNMKWFLAPPVIQWITPSYESDIERLEKEVGKLEKEMDELEVEAEI